MDTLTKMDRRRFLGATASTFTLGFTLNLAGPRGEAQAATGTAVNTWLSIGADNTVTLTIGSADMGQGSFSGLAQILSEDLMVDYTRVQTVQGGATTASPAPLGTAILTGGSGITRNNFFKMRSAGAIARETLVQAAMNQTGDATRANYSVSNGVVTHTSGVSLTYGQLAPAAALLTPTPSANAPLVPDAQLKLIGKSVPRLDIPAKVNGSAKFGMDVRLPGMVYAVIKHCPTVGGKLAATPSKPAGALAVVPVSVWAGTAAAPTTARAAEAAGNFNAVAVVAATTWDAIQAAKGLALSWTLPPAASNWNSAQFLSEAKALALNATPYAAGATTNVPGALYTVEKSTADAPTALAASATKLDLTYTLPFVPHANMEVLNCTVDFVAGQYCHVHVPTQGANTVLKLAMAMTGLAESQVKVFTTLLGGGLGRKIEVDFVAQAIQVGMALGKPVQLVWSREQDFTHGQYRPMAVVRAQAGLDANKMITSLVYRNVSASITAQRGRLLGATGDSQGWEGSKDLPYAFGSRLVEWVNQPTPVPVGYWRSVGASINTFAIESMMDELAVAAGQDPYAFRKRYLNDPRWIAVLDAAAALGGWSTATPSGSARGIAIGAAFNSIVACVVQISGVSRDATGKLTGVKVSKVSMAIDSAFTVNPRNVEAQIMGGIIHGLNAALYGQQTFVNGAAQRANFNTNPMLKLSSTPAIAVTTVTTASYGNTSATIGGVGELGVPTVAPALADALWRLSGQRVRDLPILPNARMGGL